MLYIARAARLRQNTRRDASNDGIVRDIACHYGIGADSHIVADCDRAKNLGPWANKHTIPDHRHARSLAAIRLTDGDALRNIAVFADLGPRVHNNPTPMPNVKSAPDLCLMPNFNAVLDGAPPEY